MRHMENRTNNRTLWTLAAALVAALPTVQGMAMQTDPVPPASGGGGSGAAGQCCEVTKYGVDLTWGYDPGMTRDLQAIQDPAYSSAAEVAMTRDIAGAQIGIMRTVGGSAQVGSTNSVAADGASVVGKLILQPASGWFTAAKRTDPQVNAQSTVLMNRDAWAASLGESFKVKVTGVADPTDSLSTTVMCSAIDGERDVFAGQADNVKVEVVTQGSESAGPQVTDSHRNEKIVVTVTAHQALAGLTPVRCNYTVSLSMYLKYAFEIHPGTPLQDTVTGFVEGMHTKIVYQPRGQTAGQVTVKDQTVSVLYAPVLPARWVCETLRTQNPGDLSDEACRQIALAEATVEETVYSIWRATANNGYFLQATYVEGGVTKGETHFIADAGLLDKTASLLHTVTQGGVVSTAWPQ